MADTITLPYDINNGDILDADKVMANENAIVTEYNASIGALTGDVVSTTGTQTLTNKTLTSPKINEDVALTATATELNLLDGATALVTPSSTTTLTNKTLTAPVINSPTGLAKADVGLGNVDNTSDATKQTATIAALTAFPKAENRQNNTTNASVTNQLIQSGWGFITGNGSNHIMTEGVTFPVAFDATPVVIIASCGYLDGSDPTDPSQMTSESDGRNKFTAHGVGSTSFTARLATVSTDGGDPGATNGSYRYGYMWIAIGTKAR